MKRIWLILVFLGLGCVLLLQAGCEKAEKSAGMSEPVAQAPGEPVAVARKTPDLVDPKPEPAKPKPAPDKPKPALDRARPALDRAKPAPNDPKPGPDKVAAKPDPNAPAPKIRFDKLVHDFHELDPSSSNICEFGFKNVGDAVLKILNIRTDCGCTAFTLEKKEYAPGESGTLKIKYSAPLRPGLVTRRVTVSSNDPVKPVVELTLKGKIVARVGFEPKRLNFLLKEEKALPKVTLTSLDGRAFSVKGLKSTINAVAAELDPSVEATKFVLPLKVDKTQLQRVANGVIEISLTHPACKTITIPFSALARFRLNPPVIILFDAEPGKPVIRNNVTILNNYQEDFEIASVKSKEGITKVIKQEKIRNGYRFSLEITPPDSLDSRRFTDEFSVQIKEGDLLKIKCQGFYTRRK